MLNMVASFGSEKMSLNVFSCEWFEGAEFGGLILKAARGVRGQHAQGDEMCEMLQYTSHWAGNRLEGNPFLKLCILRT